MFTITLDAYRFAINRNLFDNTDASTVFRSYFGESLFKEDTFYVIAGTDSGLLYQFVKTQGLPKGSRYLFVELPQVLELLEKTDTDKSELDVCTSVDWQQRAEEMDATKFALLNQLELLPSLGVVHGHFNQYPPFWRNLKKEFDVYMDKHRKALNNRIFAIRQIENLTENRLPAICLKDSFKGKTAVLLAGGPSLDELLPWVQKNRQNLLIIAVSRISRSLLNADLQPDVIVSVDPYAINLNVSREMLKFQDATLLVNEYHLSPNLLSSWGGDSVFMGRRYPWNSPLEPENFPPTVGNTVTNTAFEFAVECGVSQLILCGADFCFSPSGYTHASGSAEHSLGPRPMYGDNRVLTNSGMMVNTDNAFMAAGLTIDKQAKAAKVRGCRTINPALGAMRLDNVEHIAVDSIQIEPLEKPAHSIINAITNRADKVPKTQFYQQELSEVDRALKELREIKALSTKALSYNNKVFVGRKQDNSQKKFDPAIAKKVDRIDEQLNTKHADFIALIKVYGSSSFVDILRLDIGELEELVENSQIYFSAIQETSEQLIDILQQARSRIRNRIEEEKAHPNINQLIKQWQHDQQPGRAIAWTQQHPAIISQLSDSQQQALTAYLNSFEDTFQDLQKSYTKGIENNQKLDGLAGKAREFYLCNDLEGLHGLQTALEGHQDADQAKLFIPLVEGFLFELNNELTKAIDSYQCISDGPAHIDALMRLFELYSNSQYWDPALEVLKTLSEISTAYSPMYADLLQATGDIDTAVDVYTNYLLSNPDDLNTMMRLGKLYLECDVVDGVSFTMNYILEKDPGNQAAKNILNLLNSSQASNK